MNATIQRAIAVAICLLCLFAPMAYGFNLLLAMDEEAEAFKRMPVKARRHQGRVMPVYYVRRKALKVVFTASGKPFKEGNLDMFPTRRLEGDEARKAALVEITLRRSAGFQTADERATEALEAAGEAAENAIELEGAE